MAGWSNNMVATLKVCRYGSLTDTFSFGGVNSSNEAGSPQQFLTTVNKLLHIVDETAQLRGMERTIKQGVDE